MQDRRPADRRKQPAGNELRQAQKRKISTKSLFYIILFCEWLCFGKQAFWRSPDFGFVSGIGLQ